MDILLKLFIGSLLFSKGYASAVQEYPSGINWVSASRKCKEHGLGLEHDNLILSNFEELQNNEFWIGKIKYNELTPWIELIGCFQYFQTGNIIKNTVGYCEQHCRSWPYFSYKNSTHECQCLKKVDFFKIPEVEFSSCHLPVLEHNVTLVYQRFDNNVIYEGLEECMVLICDNNTPLRSPQNCSDSDGNRQTLCDGFVNPNAPQYWDINYFKAKNLCLNISKNLISPHNCSNNVFGHAWTSAFRQVVTTEYFDEKTGLTPAACLSGRRTNNSESVDIVLTYRPCNDTLDFFVCSNISIELTTTRPDHYTTSYIDFNFNGTTAVETDDISENERFSTSSNFDSKTTRAMGTDEVNETHRPSFTNNWNTISTTRSFPSENDDSVMLSSSSYTGTLVGGVIGGIVILVIVTLLLFWIRRRQNHEAKPKGVETNGSKHESRVLKHVSNKGYGLVENNISTVDEYAVVQNDDKLQNKQMPEYALVQKENKAFELEDSYVSASEGEYDKLNHVLSRNKIPDANVYDIAGKCADSEYDTMKGMAVAKSSISDLYDTNVYMHKESDDDQTYCIAGKIQYKHKGWDDTYDHSM